MKSFTLKEILISTAVIVFVLGLMIKVLAATFDSDLLPGSNNYNLGQAGANWNNLYIGGLLNLGSATSDPTNAQNGSLYYNTANNVFRGYASGTWSSLSGASIAHGYQLFTASGTFTAPAGVNQVYVTLCGGGGGGGGGARSNVSSTGGGGAGGSSGAILFNNPLSVTPNSTTSVTIGSGGLGGRGGCGVDGGGCPGDSGSPTSFGTSIKVYGGNGNQGGQATTTVNGGPGGLTYGILMQLQVDGGSGAAGTQSKPPNNNEYGGGGGGGGGVLGDGGSGGNGGTTSTPDGAIGATSNLSCGGGGGGGGGAEGSGSLNGNGGAGGNGGSGMVLVKW